MRERKKERERERGRSRERVISVVVDARYLQLRKRTNGGREQKICFF